MNLTAATAIGIWGADKLGHFWATYTFSDALTGLYKNWGYDSRKANTYADLSAGRFRPLWNLEMPQVRLKGLTGETWE